MKPHHLLSALLVAANGLAALVAMAFALKARWPDEVAVVALGVALGQISLAAAWLAWGRWHVTLRLGLLLALILVWHYRVAACAGDAKRYAWWGGLLLLYGMLVGLCLAASRLKGYEVTLMGKRDEPVTRRRPWQFSMAAVLSVTTLVAMLLGVARHFDFPWHELVAVCLFCTVAAAGHATCVYLALGAPLNWLAAAGPIVLGLAVGFLLRFTLLPPQPYSALIWMCLAQAATVALSGSVLRVAGYRLSRSAGEGHSAAD